MANPQIEQFTQDLFWKAVPWILLGSFIGTFGGLFLNWLERRAARFGREWRNKRESMVASGPAESMPFAIDVPHCPVCNATMTKRTARRGARAGFAFWGCTNYPDCRGTRAV